MIIAVDLRPLTSGTLSGVEVYIINLLQNLIKIDKKNKYILYINSFKDQSKNLNLFKGSNVTTLQTRTPNKILNLTLAKFGFPKLDKVIYKKTKLQPDVYIVPDLRPTPLSNKTKKITVIHDLAFEHFPHFFSTKTRIWYKCINPIKEINESTKVIAVSRFTKEDLINTYKVNPKKIDIIYEGIDKDFCSKTSAKSLKSVQQKYNLPDKYFLFLATLEPRKNLHTLAESFIHFKKNNPKNKQLKLVIAGKCNKKLFRKLKLPNNPDIIYTGFIDEKDKAALYKLATAFIYPSIFEGFGLPLLEAMKCQTPIITSNTSSMPEVVKDAAILVDPSNITDISSAMGKILDPKVRETLIKKMDHQIKHFTWEKCARQTLKTINSTSHESHNPLRKLPQLLRSVWKGSDQ